MTHSTEDIYHAILLRAADEWNVELADFEEDISRHFDPLVRFMAGGLAAELEQVYHALDAVEDRLQKRVARTLLPEYYHLPQPAHAIATATPAGEALIIDESVTLTTKVAADRDDLDAAFSPVFPVQLQPLQLELIATDSAVVKTDARAFTRNRQQHNNREETYRILLGFSSPKLITEWSGVTLYFDLSGKGEPGEKAKLLRGLNGATISYGNGQIPTQRGLANGTSKLEDHLNGSERLRSRVKAFYDRHFLTLTGNISGEPPRPEPAHAFLREWFADNLTEQQINDQLNKLTTSPKQDLYFLEIRFVTFVAIENLHSRLQVFFNAFPVVNRRLNGTGKKEHHYLRSSNLKWLHLQPKEDFLSIRRIYLEKPPENPSFTFKPFSDFKEEKKPSYTLRFGGVGRWDALNAWKRLAYIVSVLQENHAHQEVIEKAAERLSLEEVHQLLGKKIKQTPQPGKPTKDIYVFLHAGFSGRVSVRVEYWTSVGAAANDIPAGTSLSGASKMAAKLEKGSIRLLTTSKEGRGPLNPIQELDALKYTVLSRGRIVTREDVKAFCTDFLQDRMNKVEVADGVGVDQRFELGMTRTLDVILTPAAGMEALDWDGICHQIGTLLEGKSAASIPIRVRLAKQNVA